MFPDGASQALCRCGGLKLRVQADPSPSSLPWGCKKSVDFHPGEDKTGYGSDLVLSHYFYPEYNLLLISTRLQGREFPVPES